jgi:farnesyl-diphosphate farnesyltransferase
MTNIIKDCHGDYLRGWCYLPADLMQSHGVDSANFFHPAFRRPAQSTLNDLITKAASCLDDALDYTLTIPAAQVRLRLFNLWSLFFAINTLRLAWNNPALLNGEVRVKISRFQVYSIMAQTLVCVRSDNLLRKLFNRAGGGIPR